MMDYRVKCKVRSLTVAVRNFRGNFTVYLNLITTTRYPWGHLIFARDFLQFLTNLPGQKKVSPTEPINRKYRGHFFANKHFKLSHEHSCKANKMSPVFSLSDSHSASFAITDGGLPSPNSIRILVTSSGSSALTIMFLIRAACANPRRYLVTCLLNSQTPRTSSP